MIFFTADTHWGHANIIKFCDRPFVSIEEMNEVLISKWNAKVTGNDTVYILGDMFFRIDDAEEILKLCLSIRNCIKRAPKSTVPGQHRFGFEKPCFCSL